MLDYDYIENKLLKNHGFENILVDHSYPRNAQEVEKLEIYKKELANKQDALNMLRRNFDCNDDALNSEIMNSMHAYFHILSYATNRNNYILEVNKGVHSNHIFDWDLASDDKKDETHRLYEDSKTLAYRKFLAAERNNISSFFESQQEMENITESIGKIVDKIVAAPYSFDAKKISSELATIAKQTKKDNRSV